MSGKRVRSDGGSEVIGATLGGELEARAEGEWEAEAEGEAGGVPLTDTSDPWPVESEATLAETYFKRDRFTKKLLSLPVYGLNHRKDEDSDDESEEAYDSEDSDYEREHHKKQKQEKKKKKKSRTHLQSVQKVPQTQVI